MSKISKNIKQFRSDCGLTQDTLAEILSVSRQTVSSWETDRTQPDIEMLSALSHALGVSEEEMIYGKKNKVGLEPDKKPNRNVFFIVLSVFGTLLTVGGLILLFAEFWDKLKFAKNFFALLPLLAGFGLSFFAMTKRQSSLSWREGSAVAWVVGMAVTNVLITSLNTITATAEMLMLLCGVLCLPILFITKAVFPMAGFLVGISYSMHAFRYQGAVPSDIVCIVINALLLAVGCIWYKKNRGNGVKDTINFWLLLAAGVFSYVTSFYTFGKRWEHNDSVILFAVASAAVGLYVFSPLFKPQPVKSLCAVAMCGVSVFTVFFPDLRYSSFEIPSIFMLGLILAVSGVFVLIRIKPLLKDPLSLLAAVLPLEDLAVALLFGFLSHSPALICALITIFEGVVFIIKGVVNAKLSWANLGMVTTGAVAVFLLVGSGLSPVIIGLAVTLCGIILLAVNKIMFKRFSEKKEGAAENG